ncbi:hypothetical protein C8F01DRAFT_625370 [Mycena amicta]|nr:hypothetical protein C8F01DRAFT_625370 [Mycena amicta]
MSYVPPHRRPGAKHTRSTWTRQEIGETLSVSTKGTLGISISSSDRESSQPAGTETLRFPAAVGAIFVFDFQPLYKATPSEIFCKTNLECLENVDIDSEEEKAKEYPIFFSATSPNALKFDGWVRIVAVRFVEPRSEALKEMLQFRWKGKARTPEGWQESLRHRWAVVTLEKVEGRSDNPMLS